MRVSSLKIENFRGIRDGFVRFNKHAVLIGDNNAGKTTCQDPHIQKHF